MKATVPEAIGRGRLRLLRNALVVTAVTAACAAVAVFDLLLLVGADVVSWRWVAALPLAGFAARVFQALRHRPNAYRTAQVLDERLHLADTLSTAIFYWRRPFPRAADEEMRQGLRRRAIEAANTIDLRTALPMRIPRAAVFALVALTVLATGLTLLRYRINGSLDLRGPAFEALRQWEHDIAAEMVNLERVVHAARGELAGRFDRSAHDDTPGGRQESSHADAQGEMAENGNDAFRNGSRALPDQERQSANRDAPSSDGDSEQEASTQNAEETGASSLLSRLRNSLVNLASALKSNTGRAAAGRGGRLLSFGNKQEKEASSEARAQSRKGVVSSQMRATDAAESNAHSSPSRASAGVSSGKSERAQEAGGNGAGNDEGKKEIQLAKQLEAMGRISVILGKRSQSVTGNATVEASSGRPQLKTGYEARVADHSSVAASSDRDRIPIEYESYVQRYFHELRKQNQPARQKK